MAKWSFSLLWDYDRHLLRFFWPYRRMVPDTDRRLISENIVACHWLTLENLYRQQAIEREEGQLFIIQTGTMIVHIYNVSVIGSTYKSQILLHRQSQWQRWSKRQLWYTGQIEDAGLHICRYSESDRQCQCQITARLSQGSAKCYFNILTKYQILSRRVR